ncbi:MAG: hypothetical protein BGN86_11160 [Caulobacterales bacterium 68-7]|nr:hypothetical protein [Caulobacterales bacterium]OJU13598.1 MAG: hypothetical protein BGN86_11160 [Caulobacterales bacterium 68-7]
MQAVIELIVSVIAALFVGILAQVGIDPTAHSDQRQPEKVVARTPRAEVRPEHTEGCPEAEPPRGKLV